MKFGQKILSYFIDVPVEKHSSSVNGNIELIIRDGRYALVCGQAIYSFEDKYYNFNIGIQKLNLNNLIDKPILILGWGLGSIQQILENTYTDHLNIHGVEKDKEIVRLYHSFIQKKCRNQAKIIVEDAVSFIGRDTNKYGIIIIDIFIEDKIPKEIKSSIFLRQIKQRLDKNGLVIFNTIANSASNTTSEVTTTESFRQVFTESTTLKINQNRLLMNTDKYLKTRT